MGNQEALLNTVSVNNSEQTLRMPTSLQTAYHTFRNPKPHPIFIDQNSKDQNFNTTAPYSMDSDAPIE